MANDITVVVPSIPPRKLLADRCLRCIKNQTIPVDYIFSFDVGKIGACANRNYGISKVKTKYVAFVDDDDFLYPKHCELLREHLIATDADIVYPDMKIVGGGDYVFDKHAMFSLPDFNFRADVLRVRNYIPVTVLIKTDVIRDVGGFEHLPAYYGEDHGLWIKLLDKGYKFSHLPVVTWEYNLSGGNTSGHPDRW